MFFVLLLLMCSTTVNANGSQCCGKAMGSCRSACEQLYLDAIADLETKQQRLLDVKNFCSSSLNQFWKCINETQTKGDSKTWKSCCNHAATDQCHSGCELAEASSDLIHHCRQSDEMYLFDCVEIKQEREECCGLARKPECHNMCRRWVMSPMQVSKSLLANTCNSPVINCLATLIPRVPLRQPHKYLHCCEHSNVPSCKDACRSSLKKQSGVDLDRLQENLDAAGCTAVSIHDKMWQCFLRSNQDPPIGNYEDPKPMHAVMRPSEKKKTAAKTGVNDAKLHCCKKAAGSHCKKLCTKIFTTDFDWEAFENSCVNLEEENMNQCLDEVTEPCSPGCKNLNFCSIFNNRPLDLFRSCHPDSDRAAKTDYDQWVVDKKFTLPNLERPVYVKNIEECSPITWKAVACALQLKPCNRATQSTRICRSSCYKLLNACLDESRLPRGRGAKETKIAEVCSKLSTPDETSCVSLDPFLEAMGENVTEQYTMPCISGICGAAKFCEVNHHCSKEEQGRRCDLTECKPGCPVGQVAAYLVPADAYVPIPTVVNGKNNCYRICQCKTRIQECESLYCVPQDYCTILPDSDIEISGTTEIMDTTTTWHTSTGGGTSGGYSSYSHPPTRLPLQSLQHGSTLFVKCNLCVCFGGEITCSKRNCNESLQDVSEPSFFQLPCYCEPKYQPVCTTSGLTLMNECIAKCLDFKYTNGECNGINSCSEPGLDSCPLCVEDRKVCLLKSDDCPQHQCAVATGCQSLPEDPVCDEEGTTHRNPCRMYEAGKRPAYLGRCLYNCKDTTVCGVDGNTYVSECHAVARFISVDYEGPCQGLGVINNETGEIVGCPKDLVCPPLPTTTSCAAFIPPGACCPVCAGAIRILYSQKQIMRYQKALNTRGSTVFTVERVMKSLTRHIEVAECALYGHLTMEMDLLVLIKSTLAEPTELQLQICALEAEKLAVLIQRGSPRIVTDLSTSILVYAKVVHFEHQAPGLSASLLPLPVMSVAALILVNIAQ